MTRVVFGNAAAVNPGKHGPRDWRVTYRGMAPEHAELVFMLGMILLAEDCYNGRYDLGRYQLWYFVDRALAAKTPEAVVAVAEDCRECVVDPANFQRGRWVS